MVVYRVSGAQVSVTGVETAKKRDGKARRRCNGAARRCAEGKVLG